MTAFVLISLFGDSLDGSVYLPSSQVLKNRIEDGTDRVDQKLFKFIGLYDFLG